MLGSAAPATATLHTSTSSATPTSPTRPSRLRGLSYLRSYTHNHLHPGRADAPTLTRSTSSPAPGSPTASPRERSRAQDSEDIAPFTGIQSGENGWLPTVQGRSGLHRESLHPTSTSTESASSEPNNNNAISMTRSRAATTLGPTPTPSSLTTPRRQSAADTTDPHPSASTTSSSSLPTIRFIPHIEARSTRPSLHFTALTRTLATPTGIVRVGRYSERDNQPPTSTSPTSTTTVPVGFKSKVVSRRHCEFWCNAGQWYVRDVKSSSGTFLNHVRLSSPGQESRPFPVNDGDVVQLGIDFKGGEEVIFRCVKIRIECNRGWQKSLNTYNTTAHKKLLKSALVKNNRDSDAASVNTSECSICLNPVAPCQALFVAPCSHVWHYKCVRNLIHGSNYPNFLCPNCRFVADLEAEVDPPEEDFAEEDLEDEHCELQEDESGAGRVRDGEERTESEAEDDPPQGRAGNDQGQDENRRPTAAERKAEITGDELAGLMGQSSLRSTSSANVLPGPSRPVTIQQPVASRASYSDLLGARSTTPTSTAQFALAAGVLGDGPMTPRNDAGPFVLDGSAGREREELGLVGEVVREEREPRDEPER